LSNLFLRKLLSFKEIIFEECRGVDRKEKRDKIKNREKKMKKKRIKSSKYKRRVVERKRFTYIHTHSLTLSLSLVCLFCFFLIIITIPFLIITKFSFINSFILSGIFSHYLLSAGSCGFIYISPFYQKNLPYNTIDKFFCLHI